MQIIIGSTSGRKIKMAQKVADQLFGTQINVAGCPAESEMPDTPWDKQTFDGAKNRALNARKLSPGAGYHVGIESGLVERYGHVYEEAWTVGICSQDRVIRLSNLTEKQAFFGHGVNFW